MFWCGVIISVLSCITTFATSSPGKLRLWNAFLFTVGILVTIFGYSDDTKTLNALKATVTSHEQTIDALKTKDASDQDTIKYLKATAAMTNGGGL